MNLKDFKASCQAPEPVYLLVSDQEFVSRRVYELALGQVPEQARSFDWGVFDLERDSIAELLNSARTLPWMSERRWIYARNADKHLKELGAYLKSPAPRTVLILECNRAPAGKFPHTVIRPDQARGTSQWVLRLVRQEGFKMGPEAAEKLVEVVGEDLQRLHSEVEKLKLWALESQEITLDAVLAMAFQSREYDIFALISAIARRRDAEALRILNRLFELGMVAPQIVSMLYWNFRRLLVAREMMQAGRSFQKILTELKIWSYKGREREVRSLQVDHLKALLIRLRHTDRMCKTTSVDPHGLLEFLVVDTCSPRSL